MMLGGQSRADLAAVAALATRVSPAAADALVAGHLARVAAEEHDVDEQVGS